jgi:steroid delta-isomerase-like uncharacterized protein
MSNNKQVAKAFWKAVNERDWDSFLDYLTPDCEYIYANLKGKQAVLSRFKDGTGIDMNFHQKVERITAEDDVVVVETTWSGEHTQDMMGIPASGRRFEVPMVFIMEFRDGLISSIKSMFNEGDLTRALS